MADERLELVKATVTLEAAYMEYIDDWERARESTGGRHFEEARRNFRARIEQLDKQSLGVDLAPDHVPSTTFWLVKDGAIIVGEVRLRHTLNAFLEDYGAHIGYDIRPSYRGKGYGSLQLRLALDKARELGLPRVMLTCDADNIASARVIEKNGGILASQGVTNVTGKLISRYWIVLQE